MVHQYVVCMHDNCMSALKIRRIPVEVVTEGTFSAPAGAAAAS